MWQAPGTIKTYGVPWVHTEHVNVSRSFGNREMMHGLSLVFESGVHSLSSFGSDAFWNLTRTIGCRGSFAREWEPLDDSVCDVRAPSDTEGRGKLLVLALFSEPPAGIRLRARWWTGQHTPRDTRSCTLFSAVHLCARVCVPPQRFGCKHTPRGPLMCVYVFSKATLLQAETRPNKINRGTYWSTRFLLRGGFFPPPIFGVPAIWSASHQLCFDTSDTARERTRTESQTSTWPRRNSQRKSV